MSVSPNDQADIDAVLAKRHDLGADLWTTPDKRLIKGTPFSTMDSALLLLELGVDPMNPILRDVADLIWSVWREDGRFRLAPSGAIYPCHTSIAANVLCHLGYAADPRLRKTFQNLLDIQYHDGGWRCNQFSFGRGPETDYSNPGPTLIALNAFRFTTYLNQDNRLDQAVEFLLQHWAIRTPIGPCHYGIGTLFQQVEYPFGNYNLFVYVYVLSFYHRARNDPRFLEALALLESKLHDGQIVIERVNRQLTSLAFCRKGQISEHASRKYLRIKKNLGL
jgi:hypothetical protein